MTGTIALGPVLAIVLVLLATLGAVIVWLGRVGPWHTVLTAAARAAVALACGVVPVLALVLASGLVPVTPIAVVPIAGILIGGAMTATSLAGRRVREELRTRHGEYEAALALGFLPRDTARKPGSAEQRHRTPGAGH